MKKKLKRSELSAFVAQLAQSLIAMEACGGTHQWARTFQALGHEPELINQGLLVKWLDKALLSAAKGFNKNGKNHGITGLPSH